MGRPRDHPELTEEEIVELAKYGCNNRDIADILQVPEDTIRHHFSEILRKTRAQLRRNLRSVQLKTAAEGNPALLIWLGKQMLGQSESGNLEEEADAPPPVTTYKVVKERIVGLDD